MPGTRFGYEWAKYKEMLPEYETQFKAWLDGVDITSFQGKCILDAGCGMGRNAYWCLKYGAREVVAIDLDPQCVRVAKENLSQFPNAEVLVGDIETMGFQSKFDIVICIGVIHHLKHPLKAIENLAKAAKPGGLVIIWVYGKEGNTKIWALLKLIKPITSRLPLNLTHAFAYLFSVPLYAYLKFPGRKSQYFEFISRFSFRHVHSIVFDQLLPKIAKYYTRKEAMDLVSGVLERPSCHLINGNSWTIVGRKAL